MSERKVLGDIWFNYGTVCIGIVLMHNGHEEKAYIGVVPGHDREADIAAILDYSARFPTGAARLAMGMPPA